MRIYFLSSIWSIAGFGELLKGLFVLVVYTTNSFTHILRLCKDDLKKSELFKGYPLQKPAKINSFNETSETPIYL